MTVLNFVSEIRGTCPCGKDFEIGKVDDRPCVVHAMPYCKEFKDMEPADYLHWVNVKQGRWN